MIDIVLLTDYKKNFGSKHFDEPYRSGFDKEKLIQYFRECGHETIVRQFSKVDFKNFDLGDKVILYTSTEDIGYFYKSYIEDIVYGCEINGSKVIPSYKFLKANNNKVFMEILRQEKLRDLGYIDANYFGTMEECLDSLDSKDTPRVIKLAEGASGKNVDLAMSRKELQSKLTKMSRTKDVYYDLWDFGRSLRHKGYKRESLYRKKFIIQDFVPKLKNDWKVYIFYDSYFIFYRPIFKKRKFKASGGGYDNYFYGKKARIPDGIFDFAKKISKRLNVPQLSLDIAWDGNEFYLIEFQAVYFGTAGIPYSNEYFKQISGVWQAVEHPKDQELFYAHSIANYIANGYNVPE